MPRNARDTFHVSAKYHAIVRQIGLDAEAVFAHPDIVVWRSIPERENCTLDAELAEGRKIRLHIKRYRATRGRPEEDEARGIEALRRAGVPTAPLVGWGVLADGRGFIITEDLAGYDAADKLIEAGLADARLDALLTAAADLAAQLHNADLHHRDLYLCHFFVRFATARKKRSEAASAANGAESATPNEKEAPAGRGSAAGRGSDPLSVTATPNEDEAPPGRGSDPLSTTRFAPRLDEGRGEALTRGHGDAGTRGREEEPRDGGTEQRTGEQATQGGGETQAPPPTPSPRYSGERAGVRGESAPPTLGRGDAQTRGADDARGRNDDALIESALLDVRLIDAARVRRLPSWPWRQRWIVKDLAQFWYSTLSLPIDDARRARWLERYARQRGLAASAGLRRAIERKAARIARHDRRLRGQQPGRNISIPKS